MSSHPWSPTSQLLAAAALLCVISSWVVALMDEYKSLCRVVRARGFPADGCMDGVLQSQGTHEGHVLSAQRVPGWSRRPPGGPSRLVQRVLQVSRRDSHPIRAPKTPSEQTSDFNSHTLLKHRKGLPYFKYL